MERFLDPWRGGEHGPQFVKATIIHEICHSYQKARGMTFSCAGECEAHADMQMMYFGCDPRLPDGYGAAATLDQHAATAEKAGGRYDRGGARPATTYTVASDTNTITADASDEVDTLMSRLRGINERLDVLLMTNSELSASQQETHDQMVAD